MTFHEMFPTKTREDRGDRIWDALLVAGMAFGSAIIWLQVGWAFAVAAFLFGATFGVLMVVAHAWYEAGEEDPYDDPWEDLWDD